MQGTSDLRPPLTLTGVEKNGSRSRAGRSRAYGSEYMRRWGFHTITYRQLDYWRALGILGGHRRALGSGRRDRWTRREVAILNAIGRLYQDLGEVLVGVSWGHMGHTGGFGIPTEVVADIWNELQHSDTWTVRGGSVTLTISLEDVDDLQEAPDDWDE